MNCQQCHTEAMTVGTICVRGVRSPQPEVKPGSIINGGGERYRNVFDCLDEADEVGRNIRVECPAAKAIMASLENAIKSIHTLGGHFEESTRSNR